MEVFVEVGDLVEVFALYPTSGGAKLTRFLVAVLKKTRNKNPIKLTSFYGIFLISLITFR